MKSKNEISEYATTLNKLFDDKLSIVSKNINCKDNFLSYLLTHENEIISETIGEIGCKFKKFLSCLDLNHPQLCESYNCFFSIEKPYYKKIKEIFEFKKIVNKYNSPFISNILNKSFHDEDDLKVFTKRINSIIREKPPARFLKSSKKRKELRKNKKIQNINLDYVYRKGNVYLNSLPKNFDDYIRFNCSQIDDMNQLVKKIHRYKEIGCNFLAEDLQKSIDGQIEEYAFQYFGFNRINLITCALVLARFYDLEISLNKYQISSTMFEKSWNCQHMFFDYKPKVYPYHELEKISSNYIKKVVNYLDHMPDANGRPIFDYFSLLVLTCDIDKDLEFELIKKGILKSILIGEKDGWCYFICFFN